MTTYRLSPKGLMRVKMMKAINGEEANPDSLWDELVEMVTQRAKENGMVGIPCLVLVDGGHCITVEESQ
jgi:hypothetical protein